MPSSRKLFIVLRRPLTLNDPSRGAFGEPVLTIDSRAPVVSATSAEYSRPFSGSSTACRREITWPRWLLSVSSRTHVARDLDRLARLADREREIDALAGADAHRDVVGRRRREGLLPGREPVAADAHGEELVVAVGVGRGGGADAGTRVGERDRGVGDHGAARVAHRAEHAGRLELGERGRGQQTRQCQREQASREDGERSWAAPRRRPIRFSGAFSARRAPVLSSPEAGGHAS